jgi:hypothetical protein
MDLYTLEDDDERNARDPRDRRARPAVLRPVRQVTVRDREPAAAPAAAIAAPVAAPVTYVQPTGYAQPVGYAQPGYMTPAPGFAPPGFVPPGFASAGYHPAWGGRGWGHPGWNGPNGPMFYGGMPYVGPWGSWGTSTMGAMGQSLASGLGSLVEIGTSLVAAFQSLPAAPNSDESQDLANVTDYQRRLAEHAKGDERLRTIGSAGGRVIDLAVRLFSNPSSGMGAFAAPRWWY